MKHVTVIRNFAKLALTALAAVACQVQEPTENTQAPQEAEPVVSLENGDVIPGIAIVEFTEELTLAIEQELEQDTKVPTKAMKSLIQDLGIESMERVFPYAGEFEPRTREMGLHHFYTVNFAKETSVTKAIDSFQNASGVVSVSPSRPVSKRAVFNDPYLYKSQDPKHEDDPYQWHYLNSDYPNADINVEPVWQNYTVGSDKVIVCVVDEPVDATHPDLQGNLWKDASGHTGYNYANSSYDLSITLKKYGDTGHGTHVAGTIAAVNNNGKGVAGIAGGDYAAGIPGVKIMSHAIFSGNDAASDAKTARAIKEAADKGAVISQNSWGYSATDSNGNGRIDASELSAYKQIQEPSALASAIAYFVENAGCDANGNQLEDSPMKGGLVIFASGNQKINYDVVSSNDPNVISVGAFRETGAKASYSNYGSWVQIAAPGGQGDADDGLDAVWSTLPNKVSDGNGHIETTGYYGGPYWAGTSMACPHVSGVTALIVSYFGGQGFSAEDAKKILFGGLGNTIGGSKPIGKKMDALASFEWALANGYKPGGQTDPDPGHENHAPSISVSPASSTIAYNQTVDINITATDPDGDALTLTCEPGSEAITLHAVTKTATLDGSKVAPGTYTAKFTATDPKGASASATYTYTVKDNQAPSIAISPSEITLAAHKTAVITITGADPEGDPVVFSCEDTGSAAAVLDASNGKILLTASNAPAGTYTATVKVTDVPSSSKVKAKSATATLTYTIKENYAPEVVKSIGDQYKDGLRVISFVCSDYFTDRNIAPDQDVLSFSASVDNPSIATVTVSDGLLVVTPKEYGLVTVTLSAKDLLGKEATITFKAAFVNPAKPVTVEEPNVTEEADIHIDTQESTTVYVTIYNSSGAVVLQQVYTASAFYPVQLDVSSLAPGRYTAVLKYNGKTETVKFLKY